MPSVGCLFQARFFFYAQRIYFSRGCKSPDILFRRVLEGFLDLSGPSDMNHVHCLNIEGIQISTAFYILLLWPFPTSLVCSPILAVLEDGVDLSKCAGHSSLKNPSNFSVTITNKPRVNHDVGLSMSFLTLLGTPKWLSLS